jgi:hypothetical protein
MDLPGSSYFYTLAQVGITFAGFAAILMTLRQMRGASLSKFHLWVAQSYVTSGMVTAMNALLSPLLFGMGFSERMTWQIASVLIAVQSIVLIVLAPSQWRAAEGGPLLMRVKVQMALGLLINAGLLANAAGWPLRRSAARSWWRYRGISLRSSPSSPNPSVFSSRKKKRPLSGQDAASASRLNRPMARTSAAAASRKPARIIMPPE